MTSPPRTHIHGMDFITWSEDQDPVTWSGPEPAPTWVRICMVILITGFLFPIALIAPRTWWRIIKP